MFRRKSGKLPQTIQLRNAIAVSEGSLSEDSSEVPHLAQLENDAIGSEHHIYCELGNITRQRTQMVEGVSRYLNDAEAHVFVCGDRNGYLTRQTGGVPWSF